MTDVEIEPPEAGSFDAPDAEAPPDAEAAPDVEKDGTTRTRIVLSESAQDAVRAMIGEADLGPDAGLRLSARTGAGCSAPLQYDMILEESPDPDDVVLAREGVRLFLDPESAWVLDGLFVDYLTSSPMGEGFAFRHPRGSGGRSC